MLLLLLTTPLLHPDPHRSHFATCCSGLDRLGSVAGQMLSVEQLFTLAGPEGPAASQPGLASSLRYVRGEVEACLTEFTTWKAQHLSLGQGEHTGRPARMGTGRNTHQRFYIKSISEYDLKTILLYVWKKYPVRWDTHDCIHK